MNKIKRAELARLIEYAQSLIQKNGKNDEHFKHDLELAKALLSDVVLDLRGKKQE